ncbi:hypothetical protein GGTG_11646 [Gaeumannomyces tritici R3-111a-1]|uniref:Uncharacterized protein n=1 Tax=Gaeumannomyces tritici (strain R3-111a-1) TaxID=644352 RepID=J3PDS3_GAET3|nr:hypothetical protein GGTG_11646 [Gaeumannomyces tritici R3-111a-1]EJT70623.1 hypothetical protein GGTG_11646 [Gaeumannomyces tritici R3-111a-1]
MSRSCRMPLPPPASCSLQGQANERSEVTESFQIQSPQDQRVASRRSETSPAISFSPLPRCGGCRPACIVSISDGWMVWEGQQQHARDEERRATGEAVVVHWIGRAHVPCAPAPKLESGRGGMRPGVAMG